MHYIKAKGILSSDNGMNIYRGCTHGCIYCDSRSRCYGMNHAFEDVEVKENAPELLEKELKSKRKRCMIATGSMCDPYLPLEKELGLTRKCLEVIDQYGFGVSVLTKSDLVLRDLDLFMSINEKAKCVVQMTLTTADDRLCRIVEPYVCPTSERVRTLKICRENGIPTVVWLCPILPYINDTEENIVSIVDMCAEAGVKGIIHFGMGLTLREGNREYYYNRLDRSFPGLSDVYRKKYGESYEVPSPENDKLMRTYFSACEHYGILSDMSACFDYLHQFPQNCQMSLF